MLIMVFDVAAESGGALSVLHDYYNKARNDTANRYIFILSKAKLDKNKNIEVMNYDWIKKSWFHRLFFDFFIAPQLVKKYNASRVISLQNIIIPFIKVEQYLLVHNALPFSKFQITFLQNKFLWFYQKFIGKRVIKSIKKADRVIVQTRWMKEMCVLKSDVNPTKILIVPPDFTMISIKKFYKYNEKENLFFYPSNGAIFKNHRLIIETSIILNKMKYSNYKIILTVDDKQNREMRRLYKKVIKYKLPIVFIGKISKEEVYEYYSKATLLFPSYIETVGLPLIEAKEHNCPILVSDCEYSREILSGYDRVKYFDPFQNKSLIEMMVNIIDGSLLFK